MKRSKTDLIFIVGFPVIFILIACYGVMSLVSPDRRDPVQLLHDGAVKVGDDRARVDSVLHRAPSSETVHDDGVVELTYRRTIYDTDFRMEDANVELGPDGRVRSIRIERSTPPTPSK